MNDDNPSLEAAKRLVGSGDGGGPPSAEPFLPEIRSNIKWVPSRNPVDALRPDAPFLLLWSYGVPFADVDGFHQWLARHEVTLANGCRNILDAQQRQVLHYLGTYMHLDTGGPRYQTHWGIVEEQLADDALSFAHGNPAHRVTLDLIAMLRGYWARDPAGTDHRYGLARNFSHLGQLPIASGFWRTTLDAVLTQPAP